MNGWRWWTYDHGIFTDYRAVNGMRRSELSNLRIPWDLNYTVNKAIENINPNIPVIDMPVFLFELKDLPRMIRDLWGLSIGLIRKSDVPSHFLSYQLGWKPLFNDLLTMLDFSDIAEKRLSEIRSRSGKVRTIRRRIESYSQKYSGTIGGATKLHHYQLDRESTLKTWVEYRYQQEDFPSNRLDEGFFENTFGYSRSEFRNLFGFHLSASQLWNAIPWSFLIDYFVNVNSFLEASRGGIGFNMSHMHVMARHDVKAKATPLQLTKCHSYHENTQSAGSAQLTTKARRYVASPSPVFARDPVLSKNQIGVLGALSVVTILGRR